MNPVPQSHDEVYPAPPIANQPPHPASNVPPPPPVVGATGHPPSQPAPGSSLVKNLVIAVVLALVALAIVAILAIVSLSALGSTVQSPAVESQTAEFQAIEGSEPADEPPLITNQTTLPADAELFVGADGGFSMMISPSWGDSRTQPDMVDAGLSALWFLGPEYESNGFQSNINVSSWDAGPDATLEDLTAAEIRSSRQSFEVSNIRETNLDLDGETLRELSYSGTSQGVDFEIYSVFHLEGGKYNWVTIASSSEQAAELQASVRQYFLTLRTLQTFD